MIRQKNQPVLVKTRTMDQETENQCDTFSSSSIRNYWNPKIKILLRVVGVCMEMVEQANVLEVKCKFKNYLELRI